MSIETIAPDINSYKEPEENDSTSLDDELAEIAETPHERRLRLHHELVALIPELHELQTRHDTLVAGIIAMAAELPPNPPVKSASTKMLRRKRIIAQRENRELQSTRNTLRQELSELARTIHEKRKTQQKLIAETALTNTTITRPRPPENHEEYERNRQWKQQRDAIEHPISIHVHYAGKDHLDLTTPSSDGEPHGATSRYAKTAVI